MDVSQLNKNGRDEFDSRDDRFEFLSNPIHRGDEINFNINIAEYTVQRGHHLTNFWGSPLNRAFYVKSSDLVHLKKCKIYQ